VSHWAPRDKNPKGEIHEDFGLIGYDKARKTIVYRQFHIEGFVYQYAMEPISDAIDRRISNATTTLKKETTRSD
jgi:hypothetical protein